MKKIFLFVVSGLFSMSIFAGVFPVTTNAVFFAQCIPSPKVSDDTVSNFCTLFSQSVASCSPIKPDKNGPNKKYMTLIYALMGARYGSLQAACAASAAQNGSTAAACISQWQCYMKGGVSSDPQEPGKCSGTGVAC